MPEFLTSRSIATIYTFNAKSGGNVWFAAKAPSLSELSSLERSEPAERCLLTWTAAQIFLPLTFRKARASAGLSHLQCESQ
jgi:hypothetical protein